MCNFQTICICGGGSLGHTIAASASNRGYRVNLLTGHPEKWSNHLDVTDCRGQVIHGTIHQATNRPEEVIPSSDVILLCVPGYMIEPVLKQIAPFVGPQQEIGSVVSSSGFFWMARHLLGEGKRLFGFQRVPFISRVTRYGQAADLKGYKSSLKIGGNRHSDLQGLAGFFSDALSTPTYPLGHYLEAALTNSNPLLHPSRIYGMLSPIEGDLYDHEILFYEEWDDFSSKVLIECDEEFQAMLRALPVRQEEIPSLLSYYESTDEVSLTRKIRSIVAFKGIKMCMTPQEKGYVVDYSNRYFTEDIPYGLLIIKSLGALLGQPTPMIDQVIRWTQRRMGREYLTDTGLNGRDIAQSAVLANYNIRTIDDLRDLG